MARCFTYSLVRFTDCVTTFGLRFNAPLPAALISQCLPYDVTQQPSTVEFQHSPEHRVRLDFDQGGNTATFIELYPRTFCSEFAAVAFSLISYFLSMITALTAVVAVMIGFFDTSTSERVHHYPRPAFDRNVTSANREPRLFMVVPETKNGSPTEANSAAVEANSAAVPTEKAGVKKNRPHKPKVFARLRNYGRPGYYGNTMGYAQETQPQRPFSNW